MEEAAKIQCLMPYSLEKIEECFKEIAKVVEKDQEVPEKLLKEFRLASSSFLKKYGKECSCENCYNMVARLINILVNKINAKVLSFYGIGLASIELSLNEHTKNVTVTVEDQQEETTSPDENGVIA